ncbi:MAG: CDP-glycerol glycerophosphotransferase family protein [Candidatus Sumerlaeia bacterium]|nr:CDP-glycerol glycerophosphotransferase family protein [Candidatus Sumerlaeia bacterium]
MWFRKKDDGKKRIVFYAVSPVKYIHFRPIHERLRRDDRFEIYLTGHLFRHGRAADLYALFDLPPGAQVIEENDLDELPQIDLWISADYRLPSRLLDRRSPARKACKVQIFHGVSMKNGAIQENMKRFDKLCLVGPRMKRLFIESQLYSPDADAFEETGMPKTDCLLDGSLDREVIFRKLDLQPDRPTVLFAPTWVKGSNLVDTLGMALMRQFASLDCNFLIKLHDSFFDPTKETINWQERLEQLRSERVRIIRDPDCCPYLFISDLLISDASSIANEFTLLDRPLIFMKVSSEILHHYKHADLEHGQESGWTISNATEFKSLLSYALQHPNEHSAVRRRKAQDLFYNPGKATDAVIGFIYRAVGLGGNCLP